MNKLSPREKGLATIASFFLIFLVYWYFLLNPVVSSFDKINLAITQAKTKLEKIASGQIVPISMRKPGKKVDVYPREEQSARLIEFIDKKFKSYGIKLISLKQKAADNRLVIDIKFESTYYPFLGFLNSLPELNTVLVIENVDMNLAGNKLIVNMTIVSGYR